MTALPARLRAAALATGAVLAILLLCWAAAAGPAVLVRDGGLRTRDGSTPPPSAQPVPSADVDGSQQVSADLTWLGTVLIVGAALFLVVLLASGLRALWATRWPRPGRLETGEDGEDGEVGVVAVEEVRQALRREAGALLAALDQGAPADGIVACWLHLERAVAAAGVRRASFETSTEYAVRVLRRLDLDPRAVAGLAALYREARFSDHRLGEDARAEARSHLRRVAADLEELRT